jgi:hypothetical protein
VELGVLEALEDRIGIPLYLLFDLIVGTRFAAAHFSFIGPKLIYCSTGGIIALGLGDRQWTAEVCSQRFRELVGNAFTLRKGQKTSIIKHLQLLVKKSKYETKSIQKSLQSAFTKDTVLFGSRQRGSTWIPRVAVTATSSSGSKAYVLSNYNTRNLNASSETADSKTDSSVPYSRYRPNHPYDEIKVWEA